MEIIELFKDIVFKTNLNENLNELIKFSEKIEKQKGKILSNVGGFHSKDLNQDEPIINNLIEKILLNGNHFFKTYFNLDKNLTLKNIWLNINHYKDFNDIHTHPFSMVSGVFYIKTPEKCGNLILHRDSPMSYFVDGKSFAQYNNYNSELWWLPPIKNTLYLFPSWLKHSVEPNLSKEKRISISFNLS
jgi:uncharacterized protein (TIGR02466 family)